MQRKRLINAEPQDPFTTRDLTIGHFRFALCLCFNWSCRAKPFRRNLVWFAWNWACRWNTFSYERFRTKTRFETEAQGNSEMTYSRFSPVMWSKLNIVTIQWIKSRIWDTIYDWYNNNLAKNQVFAVFQLHVFLRSVSPKFIELCMETPCLCSSEGHKYGGRKVTETSVTDFCYWNEKLLL